MGERQSSADQVELIEGICRHIETNLEGPLKLADLASQAGLSPPHLQRLFKRITGITPRQYADARRLGRLKVRLKETKTVTTALYEAGYSSSSRLYERASAQLGMTPATYRRGGRATHIYYTLLICPLGRLLVAGTDRGVCGVSLGDSDRFLEETLREEFPAARLERDDERLKEWASVLEEHLAGQRPHLALPVDVQATAFQWRVWQELCAIPHGQTRSYQEVAKRIGRPTAARAVARACATNPVAVIVPCHRVVREDGGLGGYRWGLARKQALLERERQEAQQAPTSPEREGRSG